MRKKGFHMDDKWWQQWSHWQHDHGSEKQFAKACEMVQECLKVCKSLEVRVRLS